VPRISYFYDITIRMYWNEGAHERPHFHARYGEHQASVDLDGEIIAGTLPTNARRLVGDWTALHRDELASNWRRAAWRRSRRWRSIGVMNELVDVTGVDVLSDQMLRLTFADGVVGDVTFDRAHWKGVLTPLADPEFFKQVYVDPESGTITWPGELDLAPEPLYAEARKHQVLGSTST
jgi:Domain of unknown function (DUF4160)/Protein of unknown function (DUF2442)